MLVDEDSQMQRDKTAIILNKKTGLRYWGKLYLLECKVVLVHAAKAYGGVEAYLH